MAEFRYDWLDYIDNMQREMERVLNYFSGSKPPAIHFAPRVWEPAVDVYQSEDEIVILIELAGVRREDIEIALNNNTLTIRGERKENVDLGKRRSYYQMEINKGRFEREISLPVPVDREKSQASFDNGLLEIKLPRVSREQVFQMRIIVE
jgi:HSP20 family protein